MFSKETQRLLGLSALDNRVLEALKSQAYGISDLARTIKVPRTSLYPLLERLHSRGLVTKIHKGRRTHWKVISRDKLQRALFTLAHQHEATDELGEEEVGIISSQQSEYKVYLGKEKLVAIYEGLGALPRGTRLFGIQPNVSAYSVMKHFPFERLVTLNQAIKDRDIIVEAILQENFLEYYVARLAKERKPAQDILKAYGGRLAVTYHVSEDQLNVDSEVMFYDNVVIIANWQELAAVVIKNNQVAGLMKEFFESLKALGRRVDQNPRVEEILEQYKK